MAIQLKKQCVLAASLAASLFAALPAQAEDTWTFPINVGVVSDYVFRGQSQTWGKPAAQFSIEADHASGAYAGFAASNVSDHWLPGAKVETDFSAGYRNKIADTVDYDAGVVYYAYPGANWSDSPFTGYNDKNSLNTAEAYLSVGAYGVSFKMGRTLTEYFGWSTNNSPVGGGFAGDAAAGVTGNTRGSMFYEINASREVGAGFSVNGQVGRQTIKNSTGLDITYYKAGVSYALPMNFSVGLAYSGSNTPAAYKKFVSLKDMTSTSDVAERKLIVNVNKVF